ncbi:MAG: hypothetical protein EB060_03335 [Proteobacteria bacterium]|nr:hypothetical protein [Pseudomonadota bacterium]
MAVKEETIIEYGPAGEKKKSSATALLLIAVLLFSWAGIFAAAYYFWYLPNHSTVKADGALGNELRIAQLEQQLQEVHRQLAAQKNDSAVTGVEEKVGGLESRISSLEASELAQKKEMHSTAIIALLAVQDRVADGEPYSVEMEALSTMLAKDNAAKPMLEVLDAHSEEGTKTLEQLRSSFANVARDVMQAEYRDADSVGARIKRSLAKLVVIRKIDGTGNERDNALAGAEVALKQADLDAALQSLSALKDKEKDAAAAWMESAKATFEVQEALRNLSVRLRDQVIGVETTAKEEPPAEVVLPASLGEVPADAKPVADAASSKEDKNKTAEPAKKPGKASSKPAAKNAVKKEAAP